MMDRRGVKIAIQYLNSFFPVVLFKDELHKRAGCTCSYDDLARKLRRAAVLGQVVAVPYENEQGTKITRYQGNPAWVKPARSIKFGKLGPLFFYTNRRSAIPSPYFASIEDLRGSSCYSMDCMVWTGNYDAPIPYEGDK